VEVVASLFQGRTAAAQYGLFTYKSVPVIFEPPCIYIYNYLFIYLNECVRFVGQFSICVIDYSRIENVMSFSFIDLCLF